MPRRRIRRYTLLFKASDVGEDVDFDLECELKGGKVFYDENGELVCLKEVGR